MLDTSLDKSLTFYRSKVEDGTQLAPDALAAAEESLGKDFSGNDRSFWESGLYGSPPTMRFC